MKQRNFIIYTILLILIIYLLNSGLIIEKTLDYTTLFIEKLFPTSFIIFIIASILIDYNITGFISEKLKVNGPLFFVTFMSMISGFPSGAKYTKELLDKNLITPKIANYLIMFTHFPNPLFILGSVSSIKGISSPKILIILILSNFLVMFLFRPKEQVQNIIKEKKEVNFSKALATAITSSLKTIILIYGSCLFFYLISVIIQKYLTLSPLFYVITSAIFDLTKGIFSTTLIKSNILKELLILIIISLSSLPIHIQIKSILADTEISYKRFFFGRILSTTFALIIYFLTILI